MFPNIILPDQILDHSVDLTETVPLNVYLVKGTEKAAFIDSGLRDMHSDLRRLMRRHEIAPEQVAYILHTHSHHDHIGGTAQLADFTGARIVAPAAYAHWHSDWEAHYQEFARPVPDLIPDTPALKKEVLGMLDLPHRVDHLCQEGEQFDLGGGIVLECVMFNGHMAAEAGWLERSSDTLLLGDVITVMDAPFIHGHVT
ncbi:MAG: MBL fold metallo-hydrolase, partial [Bacteroidota bacterium]